MSHLIDRRTPTQRGGLGKLVASVLIVLFGVAVFLYPVASTTWNNIVQAKVAQDYSRLVQRTPQQQLSEQLEEADRYNAEHTQGPLLDPWLSRMTADNADYQHYTHILGDGGPEPMSQIIVPRAGINLPVYHGSDDFILQNGVGHLFGSSLPIGGPSTHAVLTGHTGLTTATLFDNLRTLAKGDVFYVSTYGRDLKYEVDDIRVVLPDETQGLGVVPGEDLVTLVTCTPYGINTHRLLVTGHRVPSDPVEHNKAVAMATTSLFQWWMVAAVICAGLFIAVVVCWIVQAVRASRRRTAHRL